MSVKEFETTDQMSRQAAEHGAGVIREKLEEKREASIIVATGASQIEMLRHLAQQPGIAWNRVTAFHLDEYVGLPIGHPASFRLYLWQRFVSQLPLPLREFHYLDGEGDAAAECQRVAQLIQLQSIDVAFIGIGENGHIAFNDPPADFDTDRPYFVADLDLACRQQQVNEGWFPSLDAVPTRAITMSVKQIMQSACIVCTVPGERKAEAVRNSVVQEVTNQIPASILQTHSDCTIYLDADSAALLHARSGQA